MNSNKPAGSASGLSSSAQGPRRVVPFSFQFAGFVLNLASRVHNEWASGVLASLWFTVFKSKQRPWVADFWGSADERIEVSVGDSSIPVHCWGAGPLIVTVHGWSGSGTQFRHFIAPLVAAGFRVACFDAPAHGSNPGRRTHLVQFSEALVAIQARLGPVDTLIAHSLGAMATVYALQQELSTSRVVLLAPHLDVRKMFETYSDLLRMRPALAQRFHDKIGARMQAILGNVDPWEILNPEAMLSRADLRGLLVYDHQDPEVSQDQFDAIIRHWKGCQVLATDGLGHNRILKDPKVIATTTDYLKN